MNVLEIWKHRVDSARSSAKGLKFVFQSSLKSLSVENKPYHDHTGHEVEIIEFVTDKLVCKTEEECLPYFTGRFNDGIELFIYPEELCTDDDRLLELLNAVCAGFAIARNMGFDGPYHLDEVGSDEEKLKFAATVVDFEPGSNS